MTEKEALNVMTQAREAAGQAFLGKVQFNVPQYHAVIKALEKQIPKKPIPQEPQYIKCWMNYTCPLCGRNFNRLGIADYCYHCGQALDWGEEE